MPDANQSAPSGGRGNAERSLVEQALANLVDQFARPLDFLRELVQNSIDAGSPRVDVWVDHDPGAGGTDAEGVLSIGVDDHGSGMDEATIDGQLLSLYASTKEDDRTKIGKFGIGFTSVFALRPDRVLVRTGRHGTWWELIAGPDRVFQKHRSSEPISGTQVLLLKRWRNGDVDGIVAEIRAVLGYWCEHALVPITFEDRRQGRPDQAPSGDDPFAAFDTAPTREDVHRPMALDDAWLQEHTTVPMDGLGDVEVVLGYADVPSFGFYSGGLTLLRTRDDEVLGPYAGRLGHLAFKVRSDRLEHTLTRDNVRRDAVWKRTLDAVARVHVDLRDRLVAEVEDGVAASRDVGRAHERLASELRIDPSFAQRLKDRAILPTAGGPPCTPEEALAGGSGLVAPQGHPLVAALAREGHVVVVDAPSTRRLLKALSDALAPSPGLGLPASPVPVHEVDAVWVRAPRVDTTTLPAVEQQLLERAQELLAAASAPSVVVPLAGRVALGAARADRLRLVPTRFVAGPRARGATGPLCLEGPDDGRLFRRPLAGSWRIRAGLLGRTLLLDLDHPTYQLHRAAAHHDIELAAVALAQGVLHADGQEAPGIYEQLLDAARTSA